MSSRAYKGADKRTKRIKLKYSRLDLGALFVMVMLFFMTLGVNYFVQLF